MKSKTFNYSLLAVGVAAVMGITTANAEDVNYTAITMRLLIILWLITLHSNLQSQTQ